MGINNIFNIETTEIESYCKIADLQDNEVHNLISKIENGEVSLSASSISAFMMSPRHFLGYKLSKKEPTTAMIEGSLIDAFLTEPEKVESDFKVLPTGCSFSSKKGVSTYADFLGFDLPDLTFKEQKEAVKLKLEQFTGVNIVTSETFDKCRKVALSVLANDACKYIINNSTHTQKIIEFNAFGYDWRGMMDFFSDNTFIADGKLTVSAEYQKFRRTIIYEHRFLTQACIYSNAHDFKLPFYFMAYDRGGNSCVINVPVEYLRQAWERLETAMSAFDKCVTLGLWGQSYDFWAPYNIDLGRGIYTL